MLRRHLGSDNDRQQTLWQELNEGTATIIGFATLCSMSMCGTADPIEECSDEAMAILIAARDRGIIEIRGSKEAFDSTERLLGVCVELNQDQWLIFRRKSEPERSIRFLDGFRQLCQAGLVMHHLQRDFSLTTKGFALAHQLEPSDFSEQLGFAEEVSR